LLTNNGPLSTCNARLLSNNGPLLTRIALLPERQRARGSIKPGRKPRNECKRVDLACGAGDRSRLEVFVKRLIFAITRSNTRLVRLMALAHSAGLRHFAISILGLAPQGGVPGRASRLGCKTLC
jgi:hypothetical protein